MGSNDVEYWCDRISSIFVEKLVGKILQEVDFMILWFLILFGCCITIEASVAKLLENFFRKKK